ncbi:DNA polymerase III subunit gamma/tau domain-containing protein [Salinifilum ghardaiensis]
MNRDSGAEQPTQRTVAELLAEYGNSPDGGGGGERGSSRRRRRRAEDPTETAPQAIIDRVLSDSGKMRPIDPEQDEPQRRGHRARSDEEPDADAGEASAQAEAGAPAPDTPAPDAPAPDAPAQEGAAQEGGAPEAPADGGPAAQAHPPAGQAPSGAQEQSGRAGKQSGKSGKANYWARRLSGKKSQARQEQAPAEAQAPAEFPSNEDTNRMIAPVGQPEAAPPEGQQPAADARAEQGGARPQQVGQVGSPSGDPEATQQQGVPPAAPPLAQASAPQPPAPQPPAPQPPAGAAGSAAPEAEPRVVEGATEQFPPVTGVQPPEGGTAVLPPAASGAALPAGQGAARGAEQDDYADEATYLGEAAHADEAGRPDAGSDPRGAGYDYSDYDDYAALDEEYSGYDDLDDEYDPELPAGMAAQDYAEDEDGAEPASGRREWLAFAGQAVVGLLLGGLVWVGFRWLWLAFAPAALVAALVVTGCLVLVARKVLRTDDLQSVLLAVLVGLVCTVSPAALLLISL